VYAHELVVLASPVRAFLIPLSRDRGVVCVEVATDAFNSRSGLLFPIVRALRRERVVGIARLGIPEKL